MDLTHPSSKPTLRKEPSDISNFSVDSTPTLISSPQSPFYNRAAYQPIAPLPEEEDISYKGTEHLRQDGDTGRTFAERSQTFGLGIDLDAKRRTSVPRVPVGSKASPGTPPAIDPLLSPPIDVGDERHLGGMGYSYDDEHVLRGTNPSNPSMYQAFVPNSEHEALHKKSLSSTVKRADRSGRDFECTSLRQIGHPRGSWLSVIILILAIYSTVFSGIWLALAISKPRYGRRISNDSHLPPAMASLLCAAFAKSIELSFTTVFVAFLGQVLTRRAFSERSRGITIAEMSMRSWIMQPGILLTQWQNVARASLTILGLIALSAAVVATFYTTASDALVTPKLKYGDWESRILYGKVATQFANPDYIKDHCPTPISKSVDPVYSGSTCVELENAGQAFHNFQQYRSDWAKFIGEGNVTARPAPVGLLYDNTTVTGSWLPTGNMTEVSQQFGRIINNVSMAMPHAGIFAAARDPINGIRQPDINTLGEYHIHASVPSPAVNILCAGMTKEELAPLVYTEWPYWNGTQPDATLWPNAHGIPTRPSWLNKTVVDEVFGFGEKYQRRHPVFPKLPLPYNTILNSTVGYFDSLYMLATSATQSYMLCSIRQSLTPNCSTMYTASLSGGSLESRCEDAKDVLAYSKSDPKATNGVLSSDWINVAISWATSLSLNAGISDGQASNARLLSQLIPTADSLDPSLPSIAEALAVLAGSTLLTSTRDAPFIHFWNYSTSVHVLAVPQYQGFNASLQTQDFASGGTQRWQNLFYAVLATVFFTNVFCLGYFLVQGEMVTDFIEPQNMFCLSLNSPPSQRLEGSCGGGPEKAMSRTRWFIGREEGVEHYFVKEGEVQPTSRRRPSRLGWGGIGRRANDGHNEEMMGSPLTNIYTKLSSQKSFL